MIICASRGRAIAEMIEWFNGLSPVEWLYFLLTVIISVAATRLSFVMIRKYTKKTLFQVFSGAEIIFSPKSWLIIPSCIFLITFGVCMILFDLTEYNSPLVISVCFLILILLGCSIFTKFSQCHIVRSSDTYYISKSWFGKGYKEISKDSVKLKDSYNGLRVYHNKKLYGVIADPGNRPWLRTQKRKFDEFIQYVNYY